MVYSYIKVEHFILILVIIAKSCRCEKIKRPRYAVLVYFLLVNHKHSNPH